MALTAGDRISHYNITAKLGEGGMGAVYEAVDLNLGRRAAIKVISQAAISAEDRRRFAREAKAASALNHPNIVTIYEYNTEGDVDFIAMEHVDGKTLDKLLAARKQGDEVPLRTALDWMRQVASALAKAHAAGIVHRDLKPGNIMITGEGTAKVLDFGLAKHEAADAGGPDAHTQTLGITRAGLVMGTPAYMSPEQAAGDALDPRSDIFSFGVILYEIACGKRPFDAPSAYAVLQQIAFKAPPAPETVNAKLPSALCELIARCLEKDREARLPSMADAAAELGLLVGDPSSAGRTALRRSPRMRVRWGPVAAAVAVLGIAGALGIPAVRTKLLPRASDAIPGTAQQWVSEGERYLAAYDRKGYQAKAEEAFQKAIELDKENATAYVGLARAYLTHVTTRAPEQNWATLALESANQAIRLNGYLAAAHACAGAALYHLGRSDEAGRTVQRALDLDAKNGFAHTVRAALYERAKDPARAEESYRRAVEVSPNEWTIRGQLGAFLYRTGRIADAIPVFEEALRLSNGSPIVASNLGAAYQQAGRIEDAASAFQRSLESDPSPRGFSNLGTMLYYLGRYADAAQAFEKAVGLDGGSYLRWANLGDAYRWAPGLRSKAGDAYGKAIGLAREQLAKTPNDADLRARLAGYFAKNGQRDAAMAEAGRIGGSQLNRGSLFHLAIAHELCGERAEALAFLDKALAAGYPIKDVQNEPELIALRKDPGYARIATRTATVPAK